MDEKNEKFEKRSTLTARLKNLRQRAMRIEKELAIYTQDHFRVCIFGSARIKPDDKIYKTTFELGRLLGHEGIDVLTGGGPGLMEAANRGVRKGEEESGSNSKSFGISIELPFEKEPNEHIDIKHHHRKFSSRLDDFMRLSNAVICTPGGIGTLLELYFAWQLIQVGHMSNRPIILVGKDFWTGLIDWMEKTQVKANLVSPSDMNPISVVDSPEEAMTIIRAEHKTFLEQKELEK